MMKKLKLWILPITLIFAATTFMACSDDSESDSNSTTSEDAGEGTGDTNNTAADTYKSIAGTWTGTNSDVTYTFVLNEDGSGTCNGTSLSYTITGTDIIIESNDTYFLGTIQSTSSINITTIQSVASLEEPSYVDFILTKKSSENTNDSGSLSVSISADNSEISAAGSVKLTAVLSGQNENYTYYYEWGLTDNVADYAVLKYDSNGGIRITKYVTFESHNKERKSKTVNVTLKVSYRDSNDVTQKITANKTIKIAALQSDYEIGDIVLKDGTAKKANDYNSIDTDNPPIAVIAGFNDSGKAIGVGLYKSDGGLAWTKGNLLLVGKVSILCYPSEYHGKGTSFSSGSASTATFEGDLDGSDNWKLIDEYNTTEKLTSDQYPAFVWANEYSTKYGESTEDWYIPSLPELCYIFRNKATVNKSLAAVNGLNKECASELADGTYWSSNLSNIYASTDGYVWTVIFGDAGTIDSSKQSTAHTVIVIKAF